VIRLNPAVQQFVDANADEPLLDHFAGRSALSPPPRFGWAGRSHSAGQGILIAAFHRAPSTHRRIGPLGNVDLSDYSAAKVGLAALTQALATPSRYPQDRLRHPCLRMAAARRAPAAPSPARREWPTRKTVNGHPPR
jgi:hypothetical protein